MGFDNAMWHLDEGVTGLFAQWNAYSSLLATLLVGILTYALVSRRDPDTHPLLLARQAEGAPVRRDGESPVFRARSAPHGMPLLSGLDIREPGVSKWAPGRDGDLRDIWRRAVAGVPETEAPAAAAAAAAGGPARAAGGATAGATQQQPAAAAPAAGTRGRILTSFGTASVVETPLDDLTRQINLIGQHLLDQGGARVAIYLPNSVEFLASLFACSFYNMTAILLPFDQPDDAVLVSMLRRAAADTVITAPGCFPFDTVVQSYPALRQLVWVVDDGSAHLDWNEVPKGMGGRVNVSTWQDVLNDAPQAAGRELPPLAGQSPPRDVTVFWEPYRGPDGETSASAAAAAAAPEEMVRFTSANLVAAVAAQLYAVPAAHRLGPADLFLPADSLTHTHTLVLTLAALYANASVVFNSVAPRAADLALATRGVAPTVVVATPAAALATRDEARRRVSAAGLLAAFCLRQQTRLLADSGVLPAATSLASRVLDRVRPALGGGAAPAAADAPATPAPGKLRLLYIAERAAAGTPPLSAAVLSDLRVFTGARVLYALAAAKVAGAVAQTSFYDYRIAPGPCAPFGPPLPSTEYLVRDKGAHKTTDDKFEGEIVVRGPAVAGNEAALGVLGVVRDDNTLAYV